MYALKARNATWDRFVQTQRGNTYYESGVATKSLCTKKLCSEQIYKRFVI